MTRLCRTLVLAVTVLLVVGLWTAGPVRANVDQCAPPGMESASALPTNLAAAAGPGEDRYTTAGVMPLG